jgi:hypothetical protein
MAMFQFELARVEDIIPWGEPGNQSLSWFALTYGRFQMVVGEQTLFRYTQELSSHFENVGYDAEYQIAAFVRDILGSVAAAVARLPPRIERLASSWELLAELRKPIEDDSELSEDLRYEAWRWLGERSPWCAYLVAEPRLHFVRVEDEIRIQWDNRDRVIDGLPVWTARYGGHVIPVEAFLQECRACAQRLLSSMEVRIGGIEAGTTAPRIGVSTSSLREQHAVWRAEFESYFRLAYQPEVSWQRAESALQVIAAKKGIQF